MGCCFSRSDLGDGTADSGALLDSDFAFGGVRNWGVQCVSDETRDSSELSGFGVFSVFFREYFSGNAAVFYRTGNGRKTLSEKPAFFGVPQGEKSGRYGSVRNAAVTESPEIRRH